MMQPDQDTITEDGDPTHDGAIRICREGVQITAEADFVAGPYLIETETTIWSAIVDAAHDLDAGVIVSDTRGVTSLRGLFAVSTSDTLLKSVGRPVLIVPGEEE